MATPVLRPLTLGEILDSAFGLYRSRFATLLVITIACQLLPIVLGFTIGGPEAIFERPLVFVGYLLLAAIMNAMGVGASTIVVADAYLGKTTNASDALRAAFGVFGKIMAVSILTSFVVVIGFLALIVPGVVLFCGLSLAAVVMVLERPANPEVAMRRSWTLTSGFRGRIFGMMLVGFIMLIIPGVAAGILAAAVGLLASASQDDVTQILTALIRVFVYPYVYVVLTVLYYDLRVRKEGFDLELLAAEAAAS